LPGHIQIVGNNILDLEARHPDSYLFCPQLYNFIDFPTSLQ
jgi:hypothetical protein